MSQVSDWRLRRALMGAALAAAAVAGCDDRSTRPNPPATAPAKAIVTTAPADPGKPGELMPNFAKGRVVGEDGRPISVPDARITVMVHGASYKADDVERETSPDANGYFAIELPAGKYRPLVARAEVSFDGKQYRFPLDAGPEVLRSWESAEGTVQNFTWKLSGVRPGMQPDKKRIEPWYGGTIYAKFASFREDLDRSLPPAPRGTKIIFTLTPVGNRADGKPGKVLESEAFDESLGLETVLWPDIPLARYIMSGFEVYPDGRRDRVLFLGPIKQNAPQSWVESFEGVPFPNDLQNENGNGLISPCKVVFTRPAAASAPR